MTAAAPRPGITLALAVLAVAVARDAAAGPRFSLDKKVLEAGAIVEIETTSSRGDTGRPARVVRVLFQKDESWRRREAHVVYLPRSPACQKLAARRKPIRALEFFPESGIELDQGGYTSLNPDYDRLVEAVVNVSYWRQQAATQQDWTHEIDTVTRSPNPYLRYLGALFLIKLSPQAAGRLEPLTHAPTDAFALPKAPCAPQRH